MPLTILPPDASPLVHAGPVQLERISIEVSTRCDKGCWFCYNDSRPEGHGRWTADQLVEFVEDCAGHGIRAVSFGGGEPLQFEPIYEVLDRLRGRLFRSLTTNGLPLDESALRRLVEVGPDKVHVSLHFPGSSRELASVIRQVQEIAQQGLRSGVNLLVRRSQLDEAREASAALRRAGITADRVVYLPMRGRDTPTPREIASVAGGERFQSMTCLARCQNSPRFCSIDASRRVGWCSYTSARRELAELTYRELVRAVEGLPLEFCGAEGSGAIVSTK